MCITNAVICTKDELWFDNDLAICHFYYYWYNNAKHFFLNLDGSLNLSMLFDCEGCAGLYVPGGGQRQPGQP